MKINVNVMSVLSIEHAMEDLFFFLKKIEQLAEELPKALAEYGVPIAQVLYDNAAYDIYAHWGTDPYESPMQAEHPDIKVTMESDGRGMSIVARGEKVLFVEFGAGVFYNGEEGYLGVRPDGVVGIGEYGKGYGNQKVWWFTDDAGERHVTSGTPASNAMYFTTQEVIEHVEEVARRILNND